MELSQTTIKDNKVYIGEVIMANFLVMSIKTYKFNRMGQTPEAIVLPKFPTYEGIPIEYADAVDPNPLGFTDGKGYDELTPEEQAEMEEDMKRDAEIEARRDAQDMLKEMTNADTVGANEGTLNSTTEGEETISEPNVEQET